MKRSAGGPPRGPGGGRNKHGFQKPKNLKGTLAKLMRYLADYKKWLVLVAVMLVISSVCTVVGSYLLKPLINDYILPGDFPGLARMLMLMGLMYLTGAGCSYGYARIMVRVSQTAVAKIREANRQTGQSRPQSHSEAVRTVSPTPPPSRNNLPG